MLQLKMSVVVKPSSNCNLLLSFILLTPLTKRDSATKHMDMDVANGMRV